MWQLLWEKTHFARSLSTQRSNRLLSKRQIKHLTKHGIYAATHHVFTNCLTHFWSTLAGSIIKSQVTTACWLNTSHKSTPKRHPPLIVKCDTPFSLKHCLLTGAKLHSITLVYNAEVSSSPLRDEAAPQKSPYRRRTRDDGFAFYRSPSKKSASASHARAFARGLRAKEGARKKNGAAVE